MDAHAPCTQCVHALADKCKGKLDKVVWHNGTNSVRFNSITIWSSCAEECGATPSCSHWVLNSTNGSDCLLRAVHKQQDSKSECSKASCDKVKRTFNFHWKETTVSGDGFEAIEVTDGNTQPLYKSWFERDIVLRGTTTSSIFYGVNNSQKTNDCVGTDNQRFHLSDDGLTPSGFASS